ncbi:CPBP family intramembrane glutamic endopeptidase [Cesiribacter sp. SM1]|uniref:CPBP family intramembrane glutamic endopeptidase n=1 Tax=Cesiribacter sp. SM1 TaxID=2861196 RepID=UPI001CD79DC0|nr:CPBP family intramembrane glutamic endopeptidase [Cesiribacter sp. SM1]
MKNLNTVAVWGLGFLCLNLYVNGLPRLFQFQVQHWFGYWLGFFVLTFLVCRYLLKLKNLRELAMPRKQGWLGELGVGFLLGFATWALKYIAFWGLGKFSVDGFTAPSYYLPMLGQALLAMFFAAILNDVSIRGYCYAFCRRAGLMSLFVLLTTLLYCLDDAWNEGFSLINTLFSAVLGLSLAYAVYKTGAIWLCTGIHWGGNIVYRLLYGFSGTGILKLEEVQTGVLYEWLSLFITALLFPLLYLLLRNRRDPDCMEEAPAENARTLTASRTHLV